MKKRIIVGILVTAIIVTIVGLRVNAANKAKYTTVKVAEATKGELNAYLSTTGSVDSETVKNYFGVQGKVQRLSVKVGDKVKPGDTLVSYEVQDLNIAVKQAQIQYDNAVLSLNDLKNQKKSIVDLDNEIEDLKKSTIPADVTKLQQLNTKKAQTASISDEKMKQSENNVALTKISLDSAKDNLSKKKDKIVSDINGVVTKINVTEGSTDNGAQPAIIVEDLNDLKIITKIGKFDADKVVLGQKVLIKKNKQVFNGEVKYISPIASKEVTATGGDTNLTVEIKVTDGASSLKVGFDVDVDILVAAGKDVVKVPAESVKTDKKGSSFVYALEGDKASEKTVVLGIQSDTEIEIKSGLNVSEKVILNPSSTLINNALVKIEAGGN